MSFVIKTIKEIYRKKRDLLQFSFVFALLVIVFYAFMSYLIGEIDALSEIKLSREVQQPQNGDLC